MSFEIELDRQVLQPGDDLLGWITVSDDDIDSVELSFQGEEQLGANDLRPNLILPLADDKTNVQIEKPNTRYEFRLQIPEDVPPTYASRNIRCQYWVKATVKRGFWRRNLYQRLQVTIVPALSEEAVQASPVELEVKHEKLRLVARLDENVALTGEGLSGYLYFERKTKDAKLPSKLSFRFACIEESTKALYPHRQVLSLETHEIEVDQDLKLPFSGYFEFPIPETAVPSGTWNLFKVHYGFRVSFHDDEAQDHRESTMVRVLRDLKPREVPDGPGPDVLSL